MALSANLTITSVTADGSHTILTDSTIYGTPNVDRNQVAVYLTAYTVAESLIETPIVVASFDPETATTFTITNGLDGRYRFYFIIVNNWLVGTTYNQYDLVWETTQNKFYQYTNATPSSGHAVTDANYFTVVTDPTSIIRNVGTSTASGNIVYQILENIADYQTAKCYGNAITLAAKDNCSAECDCSSKLGQSVKKIRTLLAVMRLSNTRQQYLVGERAARQAEKYCTDCGCLNV